VKIYKFELDATDRDPQVLTTPRGTTILSCENQHDQISLWALVDPEEEATEQRTFIVRETGDELPAEELKELHFVRTVVTLSGTAVYHVFQKRVKRPGPSG